MKKLFALLFIVVICIIAFLMYKGIKLPRLPNVEVDVALGGLAPVKKGNDEWVGAGPTNALTDFSLKVVGFDPDLLRIEYICHVANRGDSPDWLTAGDRCDPNNTTQYITALRLRLAGKLAALYKLEYDCKHRAALLMVKHEDGSACGTYGLTVPPFPDHVFLWDFRLKLARVF